MQRIWDIHVHFPRNFQKPDEDPQTALDHMAERLREVRGERPDQRDAELSCRDVFAASPHAIECIGPALIEEASAPHVGFWKS